MIVDRPQSHFIFIFHEDVNRGYHYIAYKGKPLTNKEYLEHWGKWIIMGDRKFLDDLAIKLDPYVEQGIIPCVKYDREPLKELGLNECVMCVFCDDRDRERVWEILASFDVKLKAWVYEKETIEMWSPGGILLERWIASNCKSEEEAEEVRKDSHMRFKRFYEDENTIFRGWEQ